jgi:anti-sigma B factor antagonist
MPEFAMSTPLSIVKQQVDARTVCLSVAGELDMATGDALDAVIANAITNRPVSRMTINLGAVTFLDASGVRALLQGQQYAREHGVRLLVDHPYGIVRQVLKLTGALPMLAEPAAPGTPQVDLGPVRTQPLNSTVVATSPASSGAASTPCR